MTTMNLKAKLSKLATVTLIAIAAMIIPVSGSSASALIIGGDAVPPVGAPVGGAATILTPTLSGSYDNMIKLTWTAPDYSASGYEGYAVFKVKAGETPTNKPFALLSFKNGQYSYYNLKGMPIGDTLWAVGLYDYDVTGLKFDHFSNTVKVTVPSPTPTPQPQAAVKLNVSLSTTQSQATASWSAYAGTFDGYVLKVVELNSHQDEMPSTSIWHYYGKNTTSANVNVTNGHKYKLQLFPYTKNADGTTMTLVAGAESNIAKLNVPTIPVPQPPKSVKLEATKTSNGVTASWSAYTGTFDGYILKMTEVSKEGKEFPANTIYYYFSTGTTSTSNLNIVSGHQYKLQVFPYTKNTDGTTVKYVSGGQSNVVKLDFPNQEIKVSITSLVSYDNSNTVYGSFKSNKNGLVDGFAVYLALGKQGVTPLSTLTPKYLDKNAKSFAFYNVAEGQYTVKVYAYNLRPDGTKVFHQPGSQYATIKVGDSGSDTEGYHGIW